MISSASPPRISLSFADSGSKNVIKRESQISVTPGAASFTDGFPPLTMTPIASGGIPPLGQDMNGILNVITANIMYTNAGGIASYDPTFSAQIGGYPLNALLRSITPGYFYVNSVENNASDPTAGGAGWLLFAMPRTGTYVENGTGIGQLPNIIKIGWNGTRLLATIDNTNYGVLINTDQMTAAINSEANIRGSIDATLNNSILSEYNDRVAADAILNNSIVNEYNNRVAADTSIMGQVNQKAALSQFNAGTGFQTFPNGNLMQWGTGSTSTGHNDRVFFPTAFNAAVYSVVITESNAVGWDMTANPTIYGTSLDGNLNSFLVSAVKFNAGAFAYVGSVQYSWLAMGK